MINKLVIISIIVGSVIVGILSGYFIFNDHACLKGFEYINPRFSCESKFKVSKGELKELRNQVLSYIESAHNQGVVSNVSVYVRDLESGPVMGINENENYIPASLLKLPMAITYFLMSEDENKLDLTEKVLYETPKDTLKQNITTNNSLVAQQYYKIEDLIEKMLIHSDNSASQLLYDILTDRNKVYELLTVFRDLGILEVKDDVDTEAVSVKSYSSIFRQLYNSSFVSPESSERILGILSRSRFTNGIVAGVPFNVKVAHKFGERTTKEGLSSLHDCGIVYFPRNPYLICIMTEGNDLSKLERVVSDISKLTYDEFESRRK